MSGTIDFKAIKEAAQPFTLPILRRLLPRGRLVGAEYVSRNPTRSDRSSGSFKFNTKTGQWADFATGDKGGDLIDFAAYVCGCIPREAALGIANVIGLGRSDVGGTPSNPLFAPLTPEEREAQARLAEYPAHGDDEHDEWRPLARVPSDAPKADVFHFRHGEPSQTWSYFSASGDLLGYVARFEPVKGQKEILPYTYCEGKGGKRDWRWKGFSSPTPLYRLNLLADHPNAPVLVVEGEKAADAGASLFPDHIVITSQGGSGSARKADWNPIAGRDVTIWPDNDPTGEKYADEVAARAAAACARSVRLVTIPAAFPPRWDLADPLPDGIVDDTLVQMLHSAQAVDQASTGKSAGSNNSELHKGTLGPYQLTPKGLFWTDPRGPDAQPEFVSGPFKVLAETRDADGTKWGLQLRWNDRDGKPQTATIPRSDLVTEGPDLVARLADRGLTIATGRKARAQLSDYLNRVQSGNRAICVARIGWHGEDTFVLPDCTFGPTAGEQIVLQASGSGSHAYGTAGSLVDWQDKVAKLARGNSRLILVISAAFAAPLLCPAKEESGGLHLRGGSSTGKSTALIVASTVWGGGGTSGYVRQWRATDNGLEGLAVAHCDTLLVLDELGQIDGKSASAAAYMLANNAGKTRATRTGENRSVQYWRTFFVSSGEITLGDKIAEDGRSGRAAAGQQVRVVDIPADAGVNHGIFENLHGFPSGDVFSRHLKQVAGEQYGWAGRALLEHLTARREELVGTVRIGIQDFVHRNCPFGADGQVSRVAARLGLVASAGELASTLGLVPWQPGEANDAAAKCFTAWLENRGSTEPAEIAEGIRQVLDQIQAHGSSRFEIWNDPHSLSGGTTADRTLNRLGWRRKNPRGRWEYLATTSGFKELTKGYDQRRIAASLVKKGYLDPDPAGKTSKLISVPGHDKQRLYHFSRVVESEHNGEAASPREEDDILF